MEHEIISRNDVFQYAKENFGTEPEYLWSKFPSDAILRHKDNSKWYGLIMDVSKQKLGLSEIGFTDILNVKCSPIMIGSLLNDKGYLPAYHMNKEHWITIILDGSVQKNKVFGLLDLSFELTQK